MSADIGYLQIKIRELNDKLIENENRVERALHLNGRLHLYSATCT